MKSLKQLIPLDLFYLISSLVLLIITSILTLYVNAFFFFIVIFLIRELSKFAFEYTDKKSATINELAISIAILYFAILFVIGNLIVTRTVKITKTETYKNFEYITDNSILLDDPKRIIQLNELEYYKLKSENCTEFKVQKAVKESNIKIVPDMHIKNKYICTVKDIKTLKGK